MYDFVRKMKGEGCMEEDDAEDEKRKRQGKAKMSRFNLFSNF